MDKDVAEMGLEDTCSLPDRCSFLEAPQTWRQGLPGMQGEQVRGGHSLERLVHNDLQTPFVGITPRDRHMEQSLPISFCECCERSSLRIAQKPA